MFVFFYFVTFYQRVSRSISSFTSRLKETTKHCRFFAKQSTRLSESLSHATHNETQSVCLLDRNCSETPGMCHQHATCSLVSPEVCAAERPISYGCFCNPGFTGDGIDCQGEMTVMWPKTRLGQEASNPVLPGQYG